MATISTAYVQRFAEYYRRLGVLCQVADDALWLEQNRMIFPLGPACRSYVLSQDSARALLANFRRAILIKYTDGFGANAASSLWYAVVCRSFAALDSYSSKKRSQIRKGLRQCAVERVDAQYIAERAYEVYAAAAVRYSNGRIQPPKSKETFRRSILEAANFSDVIECWAVHHGNALAGYAQVHVYGNTEANYSSMTFDPAAFQFYSSYALIYRMNEHYLQGGRVGYVNDGFRTLLHPTEFQQFLIGKFGFEQAPTNLHVHYRPAVAMVMSLPRPAKRLMSRFSSRFSALCKLDEARVQGVE